MKLNYIAYQIKYYKTSKAQINFMKIKIYRLWIYFSWMILPFLSGFWFILSFLWFSPSTLTAFTLSTLPTFTSSTFSALVFSPSSLRTFDSSLSSLFTSSSLSVSWFSSLSVSWFSSLSTFTSSLLPIFASLLSVFVSSSLSVSSSSLKEISFLSCSEIFLFISLTLIPLSMCRLFIELLYAVLGISLCSATNWSSIVLFLLKQIPL